MTDPICMTHEMFVDIYGQNPYIENKTTSINFHMININLSPFLFKPCLLFFFLSINLLKLVTFCEK